jgi:hypothetical protein
LDQCRYTLYYFLCHLSFHMPYLFFLHVTTSLLITLCCQYKIPSHQLGCLVLPSVLFIIFSDRISLCCQGWLKIHWLKQSSCLCFWKSWEYKCTLPHQALSSVLKFVFLEHWVFNFFYDNTYMNPFIFQ